MTLREQQPILNSDLLARLRLTRGLSQRQLARRVALSAPVIARLEAGRGHGELHLWRLAALADELGAPAPSLFLNAATAPPSADDVRVEAALLSTRGFLRSNEIATTFGWTLERTRHALDALRGRLTMTGAHLRRTTNGWGIVARTGILDDVDMRRLAAAERDRRGLRLDDAELLWRIAFERSRVEQRASTGERRILGRLLAAGLVERRDGGYAVSRPVALFLRLAGRDEAAVHSTDDQGSEQG